MKDKTKKRIKRVLVVIVVLGVIYALALGIGLAKLHNVHHALKASGRPMTLDAVIPAPVADYENAALLYSSAIALLKAEPADEVSLMEHLKTLLKTVQADEPNEAALQEIDRWLDTDLMKESFSLVKKGTQRSDCRFDLDYEDGFDIQMTHLQGLRTLMRLMARQAERLALQAQYDQAWQLTETMARFAEASREEPLLINQLVRIAQINVVLEAIETLCRTSIPSKAQAVTLDHLFISFASREPMAKALDGERLICDSTIFGSRDRTQLYRVLEMPGDSERFLLAAYMRLARPVLLADRAYYLRVMDTVSRLYETPYASLTKTAFDITEDPPACYLITRMFLPAYYRVYELNTTMVARLRITKIGLDLIEHRQAQDTFPDTLKDWPQDVIEDPFTGASLIYHKEANGFLLYSLGPNKVDDDGQVNTKDKREGDIAWHYSQPQ
ncbi:MAG: hypothetical protein K9N55_03180 [Phycisphaerae bacterium]|nr:hypothetical protein [Phycisphaerae bacterium]